MALVSGLTVIGAGMKRTIVIHVIFDKTQALCNSDVMNCVSSVL